MATPVRRHEEPAWFENPLENPEDRTTTVVSGARWGVVTQLTTQTSRMIVSIVLARILAPADFGILTLGITIILFLDVFKDMGTTAAIVQQRRITHDLLATLFWINICVGVMLTALMIALSPYLSRLADAGADGSRILAGLSFVILISSLRLVQEGIIRRRFQYGRLAGINLSLTLVNGAVSLFAALMGAGAWALVVGQLSGAAVATLQAWRGTTWRPTARFEWAAARGVASFSLNLMFFNVFNFFLINSDKLLVGQRLGTTALGIYGLGQRILMGPTSSISQMIQQILFPTFSRLQEDHTAMGRGYLRACAAIGLVTFPALFGFAVVAGPFIHAVLGPKWVDGIVLVTILAPIGALHSLHFTVGAIYSATGRTDLLLRWGVGSGIVTVVGYIVGLEWGLNGIAAAYAVVIIVLTWPAFAIPFRLIGLRVPDLLRALAPASLGTALTVSVAGATRWWLEARGATPAVVLAAAVSAGGATYAIFLALARPPAIRDLARLLHRRAAGEDVRVTASATSDRDGTPKSSTRGPNAQTSP